MMVRSDDFSWVTVVRSRRMRNFGDDGCPSAVKP